MNEKEFFVVTLFALAGLRTKHKGNAAFAPGCLSLLLLFFIGSLFNEYFQAIFYRYVFLQGYLPVLCSIYVLAIWQLVSESDDSGILSGWGFLAWWQLLMKHQVLFAGCMSMAMRNIDIIVFCRVVFSRWSFIEMSDYRSQFFGTADCLLST